MGFNRLLSATFYPPKYWRLDEQLEYWFENLSESQLETLRRFVIVTTQDVTEPSKSYITVPKHFLCDLASVPRLAWWLIAPFDIARPAVIHDYLYRKLREQQLYEYNARMLADQLLLQSIDAVWPEISSFRKWGVYVAVRLFGWYSVRYGGENLPDPTEYNDQ